MGGTADRDLAFAHDEVVKRLRRRQYKAGWQIQARLRVIPEVWSVLQPEFIAAGADVVIQGTKLSCHSLMSMLCRECLKKIV